MRKASKHSAILLLIGVFALGLLGAAYTLWYEDLKLNVDVTTAKLDADLSLHDPVTHANSNAGLPVVAIPPPGYGTLTSGVASLLEDGEIGRNFTNGAQGYGLFTNDNFTDFEKPQTTCIGGLSDNAPASNDGQGDTNVLSLNMGGLYPYAGCEFEIDITNNGDVPIHLTVNEIHFYICTGPANPTLSNCTQANGDNDAPWSLGLDPGQPQLTQCVAWLGYTFGKLRHANGSVVYGFNGGPLTTGFSGSQPIMLGATAYIANPNNHVSLNIDTATAPLQIHAGESINCRFKLVLDQNPGAEGKFYHFTATYKAHQWNEQP